MRTKLKLLLKEIKNCWSRHYKEGVIIMKDIIKVGPTQGETKLICVV